MMIDIFTYRQKIGCFNQVIRNRNARKSTVKSVEYIPLGRQFILRAENWRISFICVIIVCCWNTNANHTRNLLSNNLPRIPTKSACCLVIYSNWDSFELIQKQARNPTLGKSSNFYARITYGNKESFRNGIKNAHLNIRSLRNKMTDIKAIVKEKKPHVFGISECELRKVQNQFDESVLKIPGYDLLFPKSWNLHGFARVVMFVKSSLQYVQVHELEDSLVQSIWIEGGFKNSRKILFCHTYREHTNCMGNSLQSQKRSLEIFLQ